MPPSQLAKQQMVQFFATDSNNIQIIDSPCKLDYFLINGARLEASQKTQANYDFHNKILLQNL